MCNIFVSNFTQKFYNFAMMIAINDVSFWIDETINYNHHIHNFWGQAT